MINKKDLEAVLTQYFFPCLDREIKTDNGTQNIDFIMEEILSLRSNNLTQEEKLEMTREELNKAPMETVGQVALLKIADLCISTEAKSAEQTIQATIQGKKYDCSMVVTWKEV